MCMVHAYNEMSVLSWLLAWLSTDVGYVNAFASARSFCFVFLVFCNAFALASSFCFIFLVFCKTAGRVFNFLYGHVAAVGEELFYQRIRGEVCPVTSGWSWHWTASWCHEKRSSRRLKFNSKEFRVIFIPVWDVIVSGIGKTWPLHFQ